MFKVREQPKIPIMRTRNLFYVKDGMTIEEFNNKIDSLKLEGQTPEYFDFGEDLYGDLFVEICGVDEEEYKQKLLRYEAQMDDYNKWREENKEQLLEATQQREKAGEDLMKLLDKRAATKKLLEDIDKEIISRSSR